MLIICKISMEVAVMDLSKTGKLIAELRREKGLTQNDVANRLGICAKTVSKWETGCTKPQVDTIKKLAKIFGVSLDDLLSNASNYCFCHIDFNTRSVTNVLHTRNK